ncbi:hypothetical protein [Actinoplanes regularis]|uniref:hypothetical protein n=1 Tax=Actinoplanes regularis TaxID=52697 RepID=UPI000B7919A3|nr:hypothetical protein [Actinoplanes regularis]GIE87293.1 hypothetical protein Are01nite_37730 [Actinoplanes regularis]
MAALASVLAVAAGMRFSAGADVLPARFAAAVAVMLGFTGMCWALAEILTVRGGQPVTRTEFGSRPSRQPCGC